MTPEATRAVDDYLQFRKRRGEILNPNSPVIREEFAVDIVAGAAIGYLILAVIDYLTQK